MALLEGKTSTGYEYKIDERVKKDWRLIKLFNKLNSNVQTEQIDACNFLVSFIFKDGGASLEKHVAKLNDGFIPADAFMAEVAEIISGNEVIKK